MGLVGHMGTQQLGLEEGFGEAVLLGSVSLYWLPRTALLG